MGARQNTLRAFYPVLRPILRPIIHSALFRKAGIRSFDAFLMRARHEARLSDFHPRYPFAVDRNGPTVMQLQQDPNNPFGHEPELAHLIDLLVPDDGAFLDIGSNAGYFSIYLASRPGFTGHIHAFEPISFDVLRHTVDSLQYDKEITCHPLAVSDTCGAVTMEVSTVPGESRIKAGASGRQSATVQRVTLDSLNLEKADFLKVDVEGHEAQALKGAKKLIKTHTPFIFLESWSSETDANKVFEPLKFLMDLGYRLYLPTWLQSNGTFFVGIGSGWERNKFALVPFTLEDRLTFPGNPINLFACHPSRAANLGDLYFDKRTQVELPPLPQTK